MKTELTDKELVAELLRRAGLGYSTPSGLTPGNTIERSGVVFQFRADDSLCDLWSRPDDQY